MIEITSTWLEVLIKMSLDKCYISINKKHTESLPPIPIKVCFLIPYLFLLLPACFSLLIDGCFIKMLQIMYCLL